MVCDVPKGVLFAEDWRVGLFNGCVLSLSRQDVRGTLYYVEVLQYIYG